MLPTTLKTKIGIETIFTQNFLVYFSSKETVERQHFLFKTYSKNQFYLQLKNHLACAVHLS